MSKLFLLLFALPFGAAAQPTFRVDDAKLPATPTFVTYGDQRFTNPSNTGSSNPRVRQWLVQQIATENPQAIIMNGDVPLSGTVKNDYEVFKSETKAWRNANLRVYPSLGNHEFRGSDRDALENWWETFPDMRNRRWYSAQLGSRVYLLTLDSDTSLKPGSEQAQWIEQQMANLPRSIDFIVISMHHPPVADVQTRHYVDHNPRDNEIALRDYLSGIAPKTHASILVSAGHIHNYERAIVSGVTYLVSGGGGAPPYPVDRTKQDLYQSDTFPNYHYVTMRLDKERLHCEMKRVADPEAGTLRVEVKDTFDIPLKAR